MRSVAVAVTVKTVYLVFLICIAALPVVHILTGAAIPFGNDGHCDVWYYFGLMEFPELGQTLAPGARWISRLPAYVPISLWREIWTTATVQQLYFWSNHIIFTVAAAVALAALFEIRTALVVTTLVTASALYFIVDNLSNRRGSILWRCSLGMCLDQRATTNAYDPFFLRRRRLRRVRLA
jgi:hypothetical protein